MHATSKVKRWQRVRRSVVVPRKIKFLESLETCLGMIECCSCCRWWKRWKAESIEKPREEMCRWMARYPFNLQTGPCMDTRRARTYIVSKLSKKRPAYTYIRVLLHNRSCTKFQFLLPFQFPHILYNCMKEIESGARGVQMYVHFIKQQTLSSQMGWVV